MMEQTDILQEFEIIPVKRRELLPRWIKVFCWIFMFTGAVAVFCLIIGLLGYPASLAMYGFETNAPLSLIGLLIIAVDIFKGITAIALWFEKDYAITLGKLDAIVGIGLCVMSMVLPLFIENFHSSVIRLELVFLIPYLIKLNKMEAQWTQ